MYIFLLFSGFFVLLFLFGMQASSHSPVKTAWGSWTPLLSLRPHRSDSIFSYRIHFIFLFNFLVIVFSSFFPLLFFYSHRPEPHRLTIRFPSQRERERETVNRVIGLRFQQGSSLYLSLFNLHKKTFINWQWIIMSLRSRGLQKVGSVCTLMISPSTQQLGLVWGTGTLLLASSAVLRATLRHCTELGEVVVRTVGASQRGGRGFKPPDRGPCPPDRGPCLLWSMHWVLLPVYIGSLRVAAWSFPYHPEKRRLVVLL